ncbi:MAG TPA: ThiF family adenylyltransferase [Armatimonadetes bacterium]|nr:ThiF family adenylyltransferase [Armatimonadota bacterium]
MEERLEVSLEEDRYHRLRLIPWWDQERLRSSRVMVVGAGALGNEIVKNLALLGIGGIVVVDFDRVENSNLSRSVLFREEDEGRPKAVVVAERAKEINPDVRVLPIVGDVTCDVGFGLFKEMDLVLCGLDNREARVFVNQMCWKANTPWVDGAIEVLQGMVKVFIPPDGPCYECTMNETDYKLLRMRKSCALLSREEMLMGRVPTTPTISSIVAGVQVQEAVKLLHKREDLPPLRGQGFVFDGLSFDCYVVNFDRRPNCPAHDTYEEVEELDKGAEDLSAGEALELAREALGGGAFVELEREIVLAVHCPKCGRRVEVYEPLSKVPPEMARCEKCGELRVPETTHRIEGNEPFLDRKLSELGVPPYDVITARKGLYRVHFLLSADRGRALGALLEEGERGWSNSNFR